MSRWCSWEHPPPTPASLPRPRPEPYAEAVARLASVRHALRLVDPYGGGPASDVEDDDAVAAAWDEADEAREKATKDEKQDLVAFLRQL